MRLQERPKHTEIMQHNSLKDHTRQALGKISAITHHNHAKNITEKPYREDTGWISAEIPKIMYSDSLTNHAWQVLGTIQIAGMTSCCSKSRVTSEGGSRGIPCVLDDHGEI
jgi:hypothetical protein